MSEGSFTEIKRTKVIINHVKNSYSVKLIVPRKWAEVLDINPLSKDIRLILEENEQRIIIEKF